MNRWLFLLALPALALTGCGSPCHDGFTKNDDGTCTRNIYGDKRVDTGPEDTGEPVDTGTSPDAPTITLNITRFSTDEEGVPFMEVTLDAVDAQDDLPGGRLDADVGGTLYNRPIEEGSTETEDYDRALLADGQLWFWIEDVEVGEYTLIVTATDAAGNASEAIEFTTSAGEK